LAPADRIGAQIGIESETGSRDSVRRRRRHCGCRTKSERARDPTWAIAQARRFLEAGAEIIMIESEGITENVDPWRTDVPAKFVDEIGTEKLMFEAADPDVFEWYIKNYGAGVNLFVDHSQIVQLECLRAGIWGTKSLWGRVVTYRGS
jgi:phosphosulfolactate synthase (CoM biosynthesis protein A)